MAIGKGAMDDAVAVFENISRLNSELFDSSEEQAKPLNI